MSLAGHRRRRADAAAARRTCRDLRKLAEPGFTAQLDTVLPAVTCSVQSTFLTGLQPAEHGIVGNGWYFRDLGEVLLWRQHNQLVQGDKVWDAARRAQPGLHAWRTSAGGTRWARRPT